MNGSISSDNKGNALETTSKPQYFLWGVEVGAKRVSAELLVSIYSFPSSINTLTIDGYAVEFLESSFILEAGLLGICAEVHVEDDIPDEVNLGFPRSSSQGRGHGSA